MLITEAAAVFWQTLKDIWEELYSLALVNLVWLFSWSLPLAAGALTRHPAVIVLTIVVSLGLFAVTTAGIYCVTNRVARGKTFHFSDFIAGIKKYWWRAILWLLANIVIIGMGALNLWFYTNNFTGMWVVLVGGFWLAVVIFWLTMQMYYWPSLVEQQETKMLVAWRNAAYLVMANPFYAFSIASSTVLLLAVSIATTLPFIFVGMAIVGVLGNNAALTLLHKFGVIEEPRPAPIKRR